MYKVNKVNLFVRSRTRIRRDADDRKRIFETVFRKGNEGVINVGGSVPYRCLKNPFHLTYH